MAVFFSPSPDGGAEMNLDGEPQMKLKEIIRGLQAELQEHKLNFRDLEEKFILCQSTVYTLANEFQKYHALQFAIPFIDSGLLSIQAQKPKLCHRIIVPVLFSELNLDTCIELQNPPKLGGDALGGLAVKTPGCELHVLTDTMSVMKQKIMKRKQLFCKWRMACRFPGLQASENHENDDEKDQNSLNSSIPNGELQEKKEDDFLLRKSYFLPSDHANSSNTQELVRNSVFPSAEPTVSSAVDEAKHVLNDATGVSKEKIITRKILMSKRKLACRFPGLQASELDSNDASGMKNSLKLEGDTKDGSFANKHGCHIIGHIDDYTALREQIAEGKQLVENIQSLLTPTCNFLGLEAQGSEVVTPAAPAFTLSLCPSSLILVSSPLFIFVACISQ
ncbi:uncharacterized protein LOC144368639 [Ictidomys tridecemlineatus]